MSSKVTVSLNFEIHFYFGLALCVDMGPARRLSSAPVKRRSGASTQTTRLISQRGPADPSACPIATPRPDADHWHLQGAAQSASRSTSSTLRGRHPVVEMTKMMKSCPDKLPKRQQARERERASTNLGSAGRKVLRVFTLPLLLDKDEHADEDAERDNMELGRKVMMTRQ